MPVLVLSCSPRAQSRSAALAARAVAQMRAAGVAADLFDLRETPLPPFDNDRIFADAGFQRLHGLIDRAEGVVIAAPVYNWQLGSAAKAVIEATGATGSDGRRSAWFDKVVTFLCAGGVAQGYMAYGPLALSLMIDFKCIINPYVVHAVDADWTGDDLSAPLAARLEKTVAVKLDLMRGLAGRSYRSDWEL